MKEKQNNAWQDTSEPKTGEEPVQRSHCLPTDPDVFRRRSITLSQEYASRLKRNGEQCPREVLEELLKSNASATFKLEVR